MKTARIAATIAVCLCLAAMCTSVRADKDERDARKARDMVWAPVEAKLKDLKATTKDVIDAVQTLQGKLDYEQSMRLLGFFDEFDGSWISTKKDRLGRDISGPRPKDAYKVAKVILDVMRSMSDPNEAVKFEPRLSENEKYSLRVRTAMIDAIGRNGANELCAGILISWAKDPLKDTDMRVLAVLHMGSNLRGAGVMDAMLECLRDRSWRIRDVAIDAVQNCAPDDKDRVTLALINALAVEDGKLRKNLGKALERINQVSGKDSPGTNPDAWIDWYRNKKRSEQGLPPVSGKGTRQSTRVFGTESFSDRYVFVVDSSVSMLKKISEEEKDRLRRSVTSGPGDDKDIRRPLDWSKIVCKLDLAREEIIRSLEVMDPKKTTFTLIRFSTGVEVWKEELVPTEAKTVEEAAGWLRSIKGGDKTNVFGALNAALDLSEKLAGIDIEKRKETPKKPKDGKVTTGRAPDEALPDTIFLYTDGYATTGKYCGDDKGWAGKSQDDKVKMYSEIMGYMLDELEDRNRVSRIDFHTVGVGAPQDRMTLRKLAGRCRGEYVAIGDSG